MKEKFFGTSIGSMLDHNFGAQFEAVSNRFDNE
jgi:hypothetical protein